jgi:hypothetical protein
MTAAADGTIIDGNARLETVATAMPSDPIVIEHDGRRPIIAIRTDIPDANDPRAKRIAIAANRIAEVDLEWDIEALGDLDVNLSTFWSERELEGLLGVAPEPEDLVQDTEPQVSIGERCCPKCGYRW